MKNIKKLIEALLVIVIFILRFFVIFKVFNWLYITSINHNYNSVTEIYWYVILMISDLYVSYIFRGSTEEKQ